MGMELPSQLRPPMYLERCRQRRPQPFCGIGRTDSVRESAPALECRCISVREVTAESLKHAFQTGSTLASLTRFVEGPRSPDPGRELWIHRGIGPRFLAARRRLRHVLETRPHRSRA